MTTLVLPACSRQAWLLVIAVVLVLTGSLTAQYYGMKGAYERKLSRLLAMQIGEAIQDDGPAVSWQEDVMHQALKAGSGREALQMLVTAAGKEQRDAGKTPSVLVTIADTSGVNILMPLFVQTLHTASPTLAASTVVITVSKDAYDACRQHKVLCFYDAEAEQRNDELEKAHPADPNIPRNKSPMFLQIGWDKLARLQDSLATDSNILFADTDIVWLKDPLPALEADGDSDLQLTHDGWGPNIGVMFVRPTECTGAFMREWLARRTQPDSRDQYEFDAAVESATGKCPAFKVTTLAKSEFPNGCCCGHSFPSDAEVGRKWVLWHAACGGGLHDKKTTLEKILGQSENRVPLDRRKWRSLFLL